MVLSQKHLEELTSRQEVKQSSKQEDRNHNMECGAKGGEANHRVSCGLTGYFREQGRAAPQCTGSSCCCCCTHQRGQAVPRLPATAEARQQAGASTESAGKQR